ncbi:MAG: HD-GYP domain-containing protein [Deltaproteobacteria bacterium]|nr:HD-GYP domain-containing protein [Deltaproteobacteria bacterium]
MEHDTGTLVLKAVPAGPVEEEVKAFLARVFKNLSQDRLSALIGRTPVVLSKNVPAPAGAKIAENLTRLGASVDFVPGAGHEPAPESRRWDVRAEQGGPSKSTTDATAESPALKGAWFTNIGSSIVNSLAEVNKELWLVLSLLLLAGFMNYMVTGQRMVLGFYTLPTLFSAYFYGRRHATLTAFASVFLVGLLVRFNPQLLSEPRVGAFVDARWYDLTAWAGILVVTAYAMGTLHEHHEARVRELRQTYHGLLMILRQFVSKDKYTENHSYRVSVYASKIASYLGLSRQSIEDIRDASLLHDIGKLDISRELLYKAARLTEEEFKNMKQHVEKGVGLLEPVGGPLHRIIPIILAHHDKFDGTGYHGVSGDHIPLEARIVAVADVYDSLTSDRPYRKAMSAFDAKQIIVKGSGTDFDPRVVNAFVRAFDRGEMEVPEVVV